MTDLLDPAVRADVTRRLGALWAGRPVILGPVRAGRVAQRPSRGSATSAARCSWWRPAAAPVRCRRTATARSSGWRPRRPRRSPRSCALHDRLAHRLPDDLRAAVDAFDPERRGLWFTTPFVTTDEPIDGRPVTGGRPASFLALEDKLLADAVWDAAEVERAPYRIVDLADDAALGAATAELATELGAVWSGDARDGFNGGGNFVRWLRDDRDRAAAAAFFRPRCDRVRVMPFLEGVPCSIHGFVLPDGTAVLRPVEIVDAARPGRAHVAPTAGWAARGTRRQRTARRCEAAARRVGAHLQREHGYRGAFGIDGVLTADGFRPTELNTRMSAGATASERGGPPVLHVPAGGARGRHRTRAHRGRRRGAGAGDGRRTASARSCAFGEGTAESPRRAYPVSWDGRRSPRHRGGDRQPVLDRLHPERAVRQGGPVRRGGAGPPAGAGQRRAAAAPRRDVRHLVRADGARARRPCGRPDVARVVVVGGGFGGLATAARLAKLGHEVTLLERLETLGGAVSTVAADGFEWDAGPTSTLLPAVVRDLFRKSGRPGRAGAGPRAARPGARALVRGRHRARPARATRARRSCAPSTRWGPGSAGSGSTTSTRSPSDWEVLRRAYFENAWNPDGPPPRGGGAARQPGDAAQAAEEDLQGRAAAAGGRRTPSSPTGTTCATSRRGPGWSPTWSSGSARGRSPAGWPRSPSALTARMATRGVTVALGVEATDLVVRDGRAVAVATSAGRGRRGRRRVRGRPADAARAGAVRRAHDAGDAAGRLPRRPLGTGARPAARGGRSTATRCSSSAPAAGRPPAARRTRSTAAASSPRTSCKALARHGSTCAPTWSPGSTARPRDLVEQWRSLAVRRAVAGPRHGAAAARPAHPDRGRVRRRRARDAGRRAALRRTVRRAGGAGGRAGLSRSSGEATR